MENNLTIPTKSLKDANKFMSRCAHERQARMETRNKYSRLTFYIPVNAVRVSTVGDDVSVSQFRVTIAG